MKSGTANRVITKHPTRKEKRQYVQNQVYFDKSAGGIVHFGASTSLKKLPKKYFIISKQGHIIDGHHRYLTLSLLNPNVKVRVLQIDLPLKELLQVTNEFTKITGNIANESHT